MGIGTTNVAQLVAISQVAGNVIHTNSGAVNDRFAAKDALFANDLWTHVPTLASNAVLDNSSTVDFDEKCVSFISVHCKFHKKITSFFTFF